MPSTEQLTRVSDKAANFVRRPEVRAAAGKVAKGTGRLVVDGVLGPEGLAIVETGMRGKRVLKVSKTLQVAHRFKEQPQDVKNQALRGAKAHLRHEAVSAVKTHFAGRPTQSSEAAEQPIPDPAERPNLRLVTEPQTPVSAENPLTQEPAFQPPIETKAPTPRAEQPPTPANQGMTGENSQRTNPNVYKQF